MYVAVIAVYASSHIVHIDSSEAESVKTMEAVSAQKGVKNVFRTVVGSDVFTAYSNGATVKADIVYGNLGQPISMTVTAH